MNLHEYQAKELFQQFGVPTPKGIKVDSQQQAVEAAKEIRAGGPWVVAAQVHAGGRGKAGGVKFVRTTQDVEEVAGRLLGSTLVTKQTGPEGVPIHALLIRDGVDIDKEYYLSCLVDRSKKRIILIGSSEGGVDIEEVAAKTPEKILTLTVDPTAGIQPYQARDLGFKMGMGKNEVDQLVKALFKAQEIFGLA
jgi:succinyl-CoA synthetase beta subunit